jgi:hypothetical protein
MKVVINLDMKLLGNFIEIPLGVFIELTTQFISKFTPEQAVNIKVLLVQSGDALHVYTCSDDE